MTQDGKNTKVSLFKSLGLNPRFKYKALFKIIRRKKRVKKIKSKHSIPAPIDLEHARNELRKNYNPSRKVRYTKKYKLWRLSMISRDGGRCVKCGSVQHLELDHILPTGKYPHLIMDCNNVRTLCRACHKMTESYPIGLKNSFPACSQSIDARNELNTSKGR